MNNVMWQPGMSLEYIEEQVIKKAMVHFQGNKTHTAKSLGIAIRTLDNKLARYEELEKEKELVIEAENKRARDDLQRARGIVPIGETINEET